VTVTAIRTPLIRPGSDLAAELAASLPLPLPDGCVVVVASKVVSIAEGRLTGRADDRRQLHELVRAEAEQYLEPHASRYDIMLTIKGNWMFVNAGIDQSNAAGKLALWPRDPQRSANHLWRRLRAHAAGRERLGVVIADSGGIPLNWGVVGRGIAHCGFLALRDYVGTPDLYGRNLTMEKTNLVQSIAAAAVLEMGEGAEQTPVAVLEDVGRLQFQQREPSAAELQALRISLEDDAYAPILRSAPWQRGAGGS
jgi:F420-0:gamma-glutamyl ligase